MKDEQNFEINSHMGRLRTRWYFKGERKGFHEIKKEGCRKKEETVRYGQNDRRRKQKSFQEATVFHRCYNR